jgi:hypothetical protein
MGGQRLRPVNGLRVCYFKALWTNSPRVTTKRPLRVLLTGATGYVGGRLLKDLEVGGHQVRCLVRRPELLKGRTGTRTTEVVRSDLSDYPTVVEALRGYGRRVLSCSRHGVSRGF